MSDELDISTGFSADDMAQYLPMYLDETTEQLDALVEALLVLENDATSATQLNEAFRLIHSIKGSAAMMGFDSIAVLTHHLENHFERLRSRLITLDQSTMNLILRCIDFLRDCNRRLREGAKLASAPALLEELNALNAGGAAEPRQADPPPAPRQPELFSAAPPAPAAVLEPELRTVSRAWCVSVRFEAGLQLVELKAELVVTRLAELGDVRGTLPGPNEAHRLPEMGWLKVLLSSDRTTAELRAAANVDGVELIEVEEGVLEFGLPAPSASSISAAPTAPAPLAPFPAEPHYADDPADESAAAMATDPRENKAKVAETVRVDIERLDNLMNLAGELVVNKARFVQIARQMNSTFKKNLSGRTRSFGESMRRVLSSMKDHLSGGDSPAEWSRQQFDELELELAAIEEQARLWEESRRGFGQLNEAVDQLTRVSNSLQRGVLDTRMVPVAPLFNRFKRVVRDIAQELNKTIRLEIHGEQTELDKRMIDELGDPLVHLIRNAIDHGIEPAELRVKRGKNETGTIVLEAAHSGNQVHITVRDDGGGLNIDKIRRRIAERGLLPADAAAELSDREAREYIWHPGFSTADVVSGISGRGVGMDIVKTRITELNGTVDVDSILGQGSTFTVRLPLTLAIIRSLIFRLRHGIFAVPIEHVREIVSVPSERIVSVQGGQTFDVRGEFIPLADIDEIFRWQDDRAGRETTAAAQRRRVNVVILHIANRKLGLRVDELHGGQDIVIKSLAENFVHIRGLAGASILGDGSVCLLLDVAAAIDLAVGGVARNRSPGLALPLAAQA